MEKLESIASQLVKNSYVRQGIQNHASVNNLIKVLLQHKKLPMVPWNDQVIEHFLNELSLMDSNNFLHNVGVGEREGKIYSRIVAKRHYFFSHGIGRSGDISEVQPKAAGSSLLYKLVNKMITHALQIAGIYSVRYSLVLPMATGMSIALCLTSIKLSRPDKKYVIWSRIDQKSCFKAILLVGFIPIVVEQIWNGQELTTDVSEIRRLLCLHREEVVCVISTTSCFAPRQPDTVDSISLLCSEYDVHHIVNNAYGVQCGVICKLIERAITIGRVDAGNFLP